MSNRETHDRRLGPSRRRRSAAVRVEALESRALLAVTTFTAPDITDLARGAQAGQYTAPATVNRFLGALQTQLSSNLADLNAGKVGATAFATNVDALVTSFGQQVDRALLPTYPHVANIIKLNGQRISADLVALDQRGFVGLANSASFATDAQTLINGLSTGAVLSTSSATRALLARTQAFEAGLTPLLASVTATTNPLPFADARATVQTEADAYRGDAEALAANHPNITAIIDTAVTNFVNSINAIGSPPGTSTASAVAQAQAAGAAFDKALLDTTGLLGPRGALGRGFGDTD